MPKYKVYINASGKGIAQEFKTRNLMKVANDTQKRVEQAVNDDPELKGNVTVGQVTRDQIPFFELIGPEDKVKKLRDMNIGGVGTIQTDTWDKGNTLELLESDDQTMPGRGFIG